MLERSRGRIPTMTFTRVFILLLCGILVSSCGAIRSKTISKATNQEDLVKYSDRHLCNRFVDVNPVVAAERRRRDLGDCSKEHRSCVASGFSTGSDKYLACRRFMAKEEGRRSASARAAGLKMMEFGLKTMQGNPPQSNTTIYHIRNRTYVCTRTGSVVICK